VPLDREDSMSTPYLIDHEIQNMQYTMTAEGDTLLVTNFGALIDPSFRAIKSSADAQTITIDGSVSSGSIGVEVSGAATQVFVNGKWKFQKGLVLMFQEITIKLRWAAKVELTRSSKFEWFVVYTRKAADRLYADQ
jgi:hypothetical protein